jgi:hypothetical protein
MSEAYSIVADSDEDAEDVAPVSKPVIDDDDGAVPTGSSLARHRAQRQGKKEMAKAHASRLPLNTPSFASRFPEDLFGGDTDDESVAEEQDSAPARPPADPYASTAGGGGMFQPRPPSPFFQRTFSQREKRCASGERERGQPSTCNCSHHLEANISGYAIQAASLMNLMRRMSISRSKARRSQG